MKRILTLMFIVLALPSCVPDPIPVKNVPEVTLGENGKGYRDRGYGEEGELMRTSVRLYGSCSVSRFSDIKEKGFFVGKSVEDVLNGNAAEYVVSTMEDNFKKDLSALEIDQTYYFCAFVRDGNKVARSSVSSFHTKAEGFALVSGLTRTNNMLEARIVDNGGCEIRYVGFCWSLKENPDIFGNMEFSELGKDGRFTIELPDLDPGAKYIFRAFADNGVTGNRISYSDGLSIKCDSISVIEIPDANFKAYCVENYDKDGDGEISMEEAYDITYVDVEGRPIRTLAGMEYFKNLKFLDCSTCTELEYLDVSENTALEYLDCDSTGVFSLDVSRNSELKYINCYCNNISNLDVSGNIVLEDLFCAYNHLTSLDISHNVALVNLDCGNNNISELNVDNNIVLKTLSCEINNLSALDVSSNAEMFYLYCGHNNISELNVSQNTVLQHLDCRNNNLLELDVSQNTMLTYLSCDNNNLSELDVSQNTLLSELWCHNNNISELDVRSNTSLINLGCNNNNLSELDVSQNAILSILLIYYNQISEINVSGNKELIELYCYGNQVKILDVSNNLKLYDLRCDNNPYLTEIWLKAGQKMEYFYYDTEIAKIYYK